MTFRAPFIRYTWPQDPAAKWRTWTWSYNLNLIGKDQLPVGKQITDLPPGSPAGPPRAIDLRTWTWKYNPLLVGKDSMVVGKQFTDLPPRAYPEPATRTWLWSYNQNLIGKDRLPVGKIFTDLPPKAYPEPATRTWVWNYNLNLIGKDQLPVGSRLVEVFPRAYPEPATRTWVWSYNLNLVGQDAFPPGKIVTDLPPRAYEYPTNLRSWIQTFNLALNVVQTPLPFNQYDWPLPQQWKQPAQSWVWYFNLNLIGQDQFPPGQRIYDLSPCGYIYPNDLRTWINRLNLALVVPPGARPFNQFDWPLPKIAAQPDRFAVNANQFLILNWRLPDDAGSGPLRVIRDPWDRDEWGNFVPGSGIRYG
jgi:hypothetical protein